MPTAFTAPADPDVAIAQAADAVPALRIPNPTVTKAATIVGEGAGGATTWSANEEKITIARLVMLIDTLLDAGLVDLINERLAARAEET